MSAETGHAGHDHGPDHAGHDHGHEHGHEHHEPGFIGKYIFSTDHKMIGKQFLFTGLMMFIVGGLLAIGVRWQLAYPNNLPGGQYFTSIGLTTKAYNYSDSAHKVFESIMIKEEAKQELSADEKQLKEEMPKVQAVFGKLAKIDEMRAKADTQGLAKLSSDEQAVLNTPLNAEEQATFTKYGETRYTMGGEKFTMLFTMHASIMIFLVIIPLLTGAFGNFLIPLQIGARDMAFPLLNMISYWLVVPALVILVSAFFMPGGAAAGGWTAYPPLSNAPFHEGNIGPSHVHDAYTPGSHWGQTLWLIGVFLLGFSSITGAVNYVTTVLKMRAPGMTMFRMPLATWSLFITAILVLFGTPVLASAVFMLLMDRMLDTNFFRPEMGGQPLLWQHLFWFYSHPAVYIMILPGMGMVSDIMSCFSRKPLFGYKPMVYSIAAIAGLGFIVWGHHMFQSGMNPALGMTFMISTTMIALPSAVKTFNWISTMWKSNMQLTPAMCNAIAFVSMFIIGGLSGIFMASTPVDIFIHDTYFIVGHIHYVLFGGSMFAIFAAVTFWFPKMFGRLMNPTLGYIHFVITFIAFNITFFPMHIIGTAGHPRRIAGSHWDALSGTGYQWLEPVQWMNMMMTHGAFLLAIGQLFFFINFVWSLFKGTPATANPWNANTLEWCATPVVPGHGNFGPELPIVYRGPYEYGSPAVAEDYLPQNRKLEGEAAAAEAAALAPAH
ncbi:MAG TPA: cbb3-type cytochrome c oxidase subunit I [Planctomycetota bacterium]|nr:cbb3-type cytochrome c oxidase subunit I [Planctomycetota bacterium]